MKNVILLLLLLQSGFAVAGPAQQILDCNVGQNKKEITSFELFGTLSEGKTLGSGSITDVASIVGVDHHRKTKLLFVGGKGGSSSGTTGNMSVDLQINGQQVTLKADGALGTLVFADEKIELSKCTNSLDFTAGMSTN